MFAASKTAAVSGSYQISRSLRFNSADSAYLSRTPASNGNQSTWTYSAWIKRSTLGATQTIFNQLNSASDTGYFSIILFSADTLIVSGWLSTWRVTTQVFRDPSAWYHLVVAVDTTQATANNRIRVYVNGSEITSFSTTNNPTQNSTTGVNSTGTAGIGKEYNNNYYYGGYQTETYMIDGQQLTPSSFGETNAQTGVWQPKAYSGSYGTNGFYLNFSDNSNTTAATLGKDYSGNGNNWTPNNFSVTAGAGNDSLVDSPTSYGTDTGVGGTVRGNYCTLNPLDKESGITLANGNLDVTASGTWVSVRSTFGMTSGKWYWETTFNGFQIMIGIGTSQATLSNYIGSDTFGWAYYFGGQKYTNSTATGYGASYTTGDIIGIAFDADTGSLTFYKNGTSQGVAFTGLTSGPYFPALGLNNATPNINFGQRPFAYTAPSGYKALCTQNLPTPTIGATTATQAGKYFNYVLYTGTGATLAVTGAGFQPDLVWIKQRNASRNHNLYDAVRGALKVLQANVTDAEVNYAGSLTSFDSDGFSLGTASDVNVSSATYVAWNWKANGSGSTNTSGSITSTVSANTTSGFSVVTWTGNNGSGTVGHGLGVAPSMYIVKNRTNAGGWVTYHSALGATKYLTLNTTDAATTSSIAWNDTAPTSTVFSIASGAFGNTNNYVTYCFAPVAGYSAFGSYTGNGSSDGPFIYLGFTPKYFLIKQSNALGTDWRVITLNTSYLSANTSAAEYDSPPGPVRAVSNGIKIVGTGNDINGNTNTYIYAAFASYPFKYALAQPQ